MQSSCLVANAYQILGIEKKWSMFKKVYRSKKKIVRYIKNVRMNCCIDKKDVFDLAWHLNFRRDILRSLFNNKVLYYLDIPVKRLDFNFDLVLIKKPLHLGGVKQSLTHLITL